MKRAGRPFATVLPVLRDGPGCRGTAGQADCRDCAGTGETGLEDLRRWSGLLKGLGHPTRLRILEALAAEEQHVSDLAQRLRLPQPIVSQQLGILRQLRLVRATRRRGHAYYQVALPGVRRLLRWLSCNAPA